MQFNFNKEKELKEREENHLMTNIGGKLGTIKERFLKRQNN